MYTENKYKTYLKKHYYSRIMDNSKVENQVKKQLENFKITFDFEGKTMTKEDNEIIKMITREVITFKNKVKEKLNVEQYLKGLY